MRHQRGARVPLELVPFLLGEDRAGDREDVVLLLAEMREQRVAENLDVAGERIAESGIGRRDPRGEAAARCGRAATPTSACCARI